MPTILDKPIGKKTPNLEAFEFGQELEDTQTWLLENRLNELKDIHPQWFHYSDTLGERPIDGMMREILRHKQMQQESLHNQEQGAKIKQRQIQQNRGVAPGYTEEIQQQAPEGSMMEMGPVM